MNAQNPKSAISDPSTDADNESAGHAETNSTPDETALTALITLGRNYQVALKNGYYCLSKKARSMWRERLEFRWFPSRSKILTGCWGRRQANMAWNDLK